jgi:uncharacterized protein YdeI (YjbR/CyaY-like superfamily)
MRMKPIFFAFPKEFRTWLRKNHTFETEVFVGYHKRHTGTPSLTWQESVDEALCFGWIDGVRKSLGDDSYMIRFTPRKPKSIWSAINIKRVAELTKQGLMKPAGIAAFKLRDEKRSKVYSYEEKAEALRPGFEKKLKVNKKAWEFFEAQAPWYKRVAGAWIMRAVREETRLKRLAELIADSEAGRKIKPLSYDKKSKK